jgi:hypothetical protein
VVINLSKVTCNGVTLKGNPCKQTVGLVDGFCSAHRPSAKVEKKVVKVAQPEFGAEYLKDLIDVTTSGAEANDGSTKIEFVNGQWDEVPVEEVNEELDHIHQTGDLVDPSDIFAKYDYLMKYVALEAVANQNLFSAYVVKVANMNLLQCGMEFKHLKSQEDILSEKSKKLTEEAHTEYGRNIPLDIQMNIDAVIAEVTECKNKRAVVMAAIEHHESQMEPIVDDDTEFVESFEYKAKQFFGGLLAKAKKLMPKTLMAVGALLVLLAVAATFSMGDRSAPAPKVDDKPVVQHKPVVHTPSPVIDNGPTDNVAARQEFNASHKPVTHVINPDNPTAPVYHQVVHGDSLWKVAVEVYGNGQEWVRIYDANKDKLTRDDTRNVTDAGHWIHEGQTLTIPQDGE